MHRYLAAEWDSRAQATFRAVNDRTSEAQALLRSYVVRYGMVPVLHDTKRRSSFVQGAGENGIAFAPEAQIVDKLVKRHEALVAAAEANKGASRTAVQAGGDGRRGREGKASGDDGGGWLRAGDARAAR